MTSVWIPIGVYVCINHDPAVTYDNSAPQATRAACEAIVDIQRARNDANSDMIGYAIQCINFEVKAKANAVVEVKPDAVAKTEPFRLNKHAPGYDFWGPLFHDAAWRAS